MQDIFSYIMDMSTETLYPRTRVDPNVFSGFSARPVFQQASAILLFQFVIFSRAWANVAASNDAAGCAEICSWCDNHPLPAIRLN